MRPQAPARRVVLSTADPRHPTARRLLAELEAQGLSATVCTAADDAEAVEAAVEGCDVFVAVVTHGYLDCAAMIEQVEIVARARERRGGPHLFIFWIDKLRLPEPLAILRMDGQELPMKPGRAARRLLTSQGKRSITRVSAPSHPPLPPYTAERVLAQMGLAALRPTGETPRALRVLFMPSFHPEIVIEIEWGESSGLVRLYSMCTNLGQWAYEELSMELVPDRRLDPSVPAPSPWSEQAPLASAALQGWRSLVAEVDLAGLGDSPPCGLDGVTVELDFVDGERSTRASCWSPEQGSLHHRVVDGARELALEALRQETSAILLEQLYGYLRASLPIRDLGGRPRHLRLFGLLSSGMEAPLEDYFDRFGADERLLVDMRNCDGMGTCMHPSLAAIDRRFPALAWVHLDSPRGELISQHLLAAGISRERLFGDLAAATAALRSPASS